MFRDLPVTLSEKKNIAENTVELTFAVSYRALPSNQGSIYLLKSIIKEASVLDRCHDFSIASSPSDPREFSIAFRASKVLLKPSY